MAKNSSDENRRTASSPLTARWAKPQTERRKILFPTEPSTIGHKKIDRAVERVVSRKR
jgi:hypothetical protein